MPAKRSNHSKPPPALRERAEEALRVSPADIAGMTAEEIQKLVHELQVHQIELKLQNEELLTAQVELAHSRDRFNDLYDCAPVGYVTIDAEGTILEANRTAATMLGVERQNLVGRKFSRVVAPAAQEALHLHQQAVFAGAEKHVCELVLRRTDGTEFPIRMESIGVQDPATPARHCRSAIIDISDRKAAEQALVASAERLRLVTDGTPALIAYIDADFRYQSVNRLWAEWFALTPEGVEGRTVREVVGEEAWEFLRPLMTRALAGEMVSFERPLRHHDDSLRWLQITYAPDRNVQARIRGFVAHAHDITERKLAEEKLRASEERFRQMFEHHQAVMLLIEPNTGAIVDANAAAVQFYGYSPEQLRALRIQDINQLPADAVAAARQEATARKRTHFIFQHRLASGDLRWVEVYATPVETGGRTLLFSVTHDVTARKQAEDQLVASERRFRALTVKAAEDIILLDAQGRITYESPHELSLLGFAPGEMTGRSAFDLIHPDDLRPARQQFAEVLGAPIATARGELRMRRKDGGWSWIHFHATNLLHDPAVGAVVMNLRNITARKEAEEALRKSREDFARAEAVGQLGWWRLDTRGNVLTWSDENHRIFGLPKGRPLTYETFLGCVHPDDRQYVDTQWQAGVRGEPYDIEHRIIVADAVKWVREKAYLEFDGAGELLGGFGIAQDITARKLAEEALREHSERLALLSDAASALLTAADPGMFLDGIYARLSDLLGLEVCVHHTLAPGNKHLELAVSRSLSEQEAAQLQRVNLGESVCGTAAASGQPAVGEDLQHSTDKGTALLRSFGLTAYVCHPLRVKGRLLGTLFFGTRKGTRIEPKVLPLIKTVCSQVATAIERRDDEEALRQSEERLRLALDAGHMGTWEWERNDIHVIWNAREFELVGLPADPRGHITPHAFLKLVHPEDRDRMVAQTEHCLATGTDFYGEFRIIRPDGTIRWLAEVGRPQPSGTTVRSDRMVGVTYDITERKQAEEALARLNATLEQQVADRTHALRASERRFRSIYENAATGIAMNNIGGRFIQCNPAYCQITGYSEQELCAMNFSSLIHPDDLPETLELVRRLLDDEIPSFGSEHRYVHKNGDTVWVHKFGSLLRDERGRGANMITLVTDVTNRKLAEAALRESEERFRQVTEAIDQAFWMTTVDKSQMLYVSPGYDRMWGRTCQSLYDSPRDWLEAVHPDDRARVEDAALTKQASGEYDVEYRILRPDGAERWIHDHAFPVRDASGQVHRVAGIAEDITERKRLQEEIIAAGERERERLGQNLHDGLCQVLTAARLKADSLVTRLADQEPASVHSVKSVASLIAQAVDEAHGLARGLEPVEPLPEGLMAALQGLAATTSRLFNADCACEFPRPVLVPDHKVATELFRIAQEATNNAIKHGHATRIRIQFAEERGTAVLSVVSDGKPFPKRQRALGLGLKTMRFRAGRIGATIEIGRGPRKGTLVRCAFPATSAPPGASKPGELPAPLSPPAADSADPFNKKGPTP